MDLRTYLHAIRRSWWAVLIAVILGVAGGWYANASATPIYAAKIQFYISTPSSAAVSAASSDQFAQNRANSYAQLLSSDALARAIVETAGLKESPTDLSSQITGTADINTVLVTATVEDPRPPRALRIAQGVAVEFPKLVEQLDNRTADSGGVQLIVISGPHVGSAPVSPRKSLNLLYGFGVGLLVGLLFAVVRYLRDTTVQRAEDVEAITKSPLLGSIAYDSTARSQPVVLDLAAPTPRSESFRQLRTALQFIDMARPISTLAVTSSSEDEGKSTTAANLALMLVEGGRSVVLVEADLRRPRLADYLGLERSVGLTNVLINAVPLEDALQPWQPGLSVLVAGALPPNPSELLGSDEMIGLLAGLSERFDVVVIDTPPLLPVTDAAVVAAIVDGVLLVCRYGRTKKSQLAIAVRSLSAVQAKLVGSVLTMRPERAGHSSRYYNRTGKVRRRDRGRGESRGAGAGWTPAAITTDGRRDVRAVAPTSAATTSAATTASGTTASGRKPAVPTGRHVDRPGANRARRGNVARQGVPTPPDKQAWAEDGSAPGNGRRVMAGDDADDPADRGSRRTGR